MISDELKRMTQTATNYRKYLEPRTLARIHALDLRARLIVEGLMTGMHRSPYQGISVEFAQHRPYVQGDDTRHIDWKVFGKTDKIYLKQYLEETNLHLICIVDASESMGYGTVRGIEDRGSRIEDGTESIRSSIFDSRSSTLWTKYDRATAIAASLSYMAIQQQDSVRLAIF